MIYRADISISLSGRELDRTRYKSVCVEADDGQGAALAAAGTMTPETRILIYDITVTRTDDRRKLTFTSLWRFEAGRVT